MNVIISLFRDIKKASLLELQEEIIPELEHAIINQQLHSPLLIRLLKYARKRAKHLYELKGPWSLQNSEFKVKEVFT